MNSVQDESQRVLTLLKLDAQNLRDRIVEREKEYLRVFSEKRTRAHFPEVFFSRWKSLGASELKLVSQELMLTLDKFYNAVEKMQWYLNYTEDMPATVEDKMEHYIHEIDSAFQVLTLYIEGELGYHDKDEAVNERGEYSS